jgi:hypothetical protein
MLSLPERERAELREDVKLMRELGILRWKGIIIGPEPSAKSEVKPEPQLSDEEHSALNKRLYYEDLFSRAIDDDTLEKLPWPV